jgi:hypothetical protein
MQIQLIKGGLGPDELCCVRRDGSKVRGTLQPNSVFHDIAHFVVEMQLLIPDGFWGMIAQGYALEDYDLPNELRPFQISDQGYRAEFLATLVQSATSTGQLSETYVEFLKRATLSANLPFPELPPAEILQQMIVDTQKLWKQWADLPAGSSLEMRFGVGTT